MRLNDETMLVLAEALQNECLDRDCEYCKFADGVDCMFENRPLYYELPDTAAEVERTRQMKQKAGKEHGHTDRSATEKTESIVLENIVARLRAEFTNLIPDTHPNAIVYNMGYAAAIRDLEHIVEDVIAERRGEDGTSE